MPARQNKAEQELRHESTWEIDAGEAELVRETPDLLVTVANEREAVFARLRECRKRYPKLHLVIEPTGGKVVIAVAAALHIAVTRVNARQLRDFARRLGWLKKSDRSMPGCCAVTRNGPADAHR